MADVWTQWKPWVGRFTGSYLGNTSAPPRACRSALRKSSCTRAPSLAATETAVFWSMTGSTWNITAAVVSLSLRRQRLFVLSTPGYRVGVIRRATSAPVIWYSTYALGVSVLSWVWKEFRDSGLILIVESRILLCWQIWASRGRNVRDIMAVKMMVRMKSAFFPMASKHFTSNLSWTV